MRLDTIARRSACGAAAWMFVASAVTADVPRKIHYQGKLRETSGALINGNITLQLKLYDNANGAGTPLFTETHSVVPVSNGLFSVLIGSQTGGGVPDSALNAAEVYLGISVNGTAEATPRPQVVSNPHAIKAKSSEQLVKPGTFAPAAVVDSAGKVGIGTSTPQAALDISSDGSTVLVPRKSSSGDPDNPINGMIYYNSLSGKFRGYENGSWGDMRDGSGSASDPCNCPVNPWSLVGTVNSTKAGTGIQSGGVIITDNSKEYLIVVCEVSNPEFTVSPSAPSAVFRTTAPGRPNHTYKVAVRDDAGTWRSAGVYDETNATNLIGRGALWDASGGSGLMHSFYGPSTNALAYIYADGTVKLYDTDGTYDAAVLVFSRVP